MPANDPNATFAFLESGHRPIARSLSGGGSFGGAPESEHRFRRKVSRTFTFT
jgi:hypothetical protein